MHAMIAWLLSLFDPPRPRPVPQHLLDGRRSAIERNYGKWERLS